MIYIQVYVPDKNKVYDFRVPIKITIASLKNLVLEAVYDIGYDYDFVKDKFLFINFYNREILDNKLCIKDYSVHDGEKFVLI